MCKNTGANDAMDFLSSSTPFEEKSPMPRAPKTQRPKPGHHVLSPNGFGHLQYDISSRPQKGTTINSPKILFSLNNDMSDPDKKKVTELVRGSGTQNQGGGGAESVAHLRTQLLQNCNLLPTYIACFSQNFSKISGRDVRNLCQPNIINP